MKERSLVFIDGENVIRRWKAYCRERGIFSKIDYIKLIEKLSENTNLLRAYFYDGIPEQVPSHKKKFLEILQRNGVQLRLKVLKNRVTICPKCGHKDERFVQKGVDVALVTDILRHAWQQTCEICIIVSGDEDYKDAVECAKDRGIKVWVASFKRSLAKELRTCADKIIFLDEIFDKINFK